LKFFGLSPHANAQFAILSELHCVAGHYKIANGCEGGARYMLQSAVTGCDVLGGERLATTHLNVKTNEM
jgi:hypothetical protein